MSVDYKIRQSVMLIGGIFVEFVQLYSLWGRLVEITQKMSITWYYFTITSEISSLFYAHA